MGIGFFAPFMVIGSKPPSRVTVCAPKRSIGSRTRRIGRLRSEASPVKVAVIGVVATAPNMRRTPVPELP